MKYVVVPKAFSCPDKKVATDKMGNIYLADTGSAHTNRWSADQEIRQLARKYGVSELAFEIRKAKGVLTYELGEVV